MIIRYKCPSCNCESLMIDNDGYIICSLLNCKEPDSFHKIAASAGILSKTISYFTERLVWHDEQLKSLMLGGQQVLTTIHECRAKIKELEEKLNGTNQA